MRLSDELEAEIAKLVWVYQDDDTRESREQVIANPREGIALEGPWHSIESREAHAECEALRDQIRAVVRKAVETERAWFRDMLARYNDDEMPGRISVSEIGNALYEREVAGRGSKT